MAATVVISIFLSLLLTWLALVVLLVSTRPRGMDLREARAFVPDLVRLISRLARQPSLGRSTRLRLTLLLAYLASPIDLIPDFIPVLGYADDVIIITIALRAIVRHAGAEALDENWTGSDMGLVTIQRLAGLDRT